MKTTNKMGTISKRIILVSAIVLFAGSLTAITADQVNPLEKHSSTLFISTMFFALFLIYLAGTLMNNPPLRVTNYNESQKRHHHHRKIIKKTA